MLRRLALLLALVPLAAAAEPPEADLRAPEIALFEAGILCAPEAVGTEPAPDTVAGFTNVIEGDPGFVSHGRLVPAVIGVGFGVRAQSKAADFPAVTMVVTHPPMGPEGVTRQSYGSAIGSADTSLSYYHLEYDYELVIGRWTFTALDGDRVLYAAVFDVVPPAEVPELASICGYEDLIS